MGIGWNNAVICKRVGSPVNPPHKGLQFPKAFDQTTATCLGVIQSRGPAPFDTKEQGSSHKIGKGARSRQMIILEQGAPKMIKRNMD